jgi:hypothetical protein
MMNVHLCATERASRFESALITQLALMYKVFFLCLREEYKKQKDPDKLSSVTITTLSHMVVLYKLV